jgi:uncharacterized protein HemX
MDVKTAEHIAQSQFVFGILFIMLLLGGITAAIWLFKNLRDENNEREKQLKQFYDDQKAESKEREQRLMEHLERTTEAQEEMARTLEKVQSGLSNLEINLKELSLEVKHLKRGHH